MLNLFAQTTLTTEEVSVSSGAAGGLAAVWILGVLAIWILSIVALWKIFEKADEPGWKAIVPLYNTYTLCRVAGRNGWWILGFMVPFVNIIVGLVIAIDLAKHFGKDTVFGVVALWLFSLIGLFLIGFGDAKYVGPKHA